MREPYSGYLERLKAQLLGPLGKLPVRVRRDIIEGRIVEDELNAFVVRVRASASTVTHQHIAQLKASGLDEDEIFDAAVCAAFVVGAERYQAAMKALAESREGGESGDAT